MEINEKKIAERQVAYINYKGSYEEVPVLMGKWSGLSWPKACR
jgi:hypothetical protein